MDRLTAQVKLLMESEKEARNETRDTKDALQAQIDYLREEVQLNEETATERDKLRVQLDEMRMHAQRKDEAAARDMAELQEATAASIAEAVASAEKRQFERENVLIEVGEEEKRTLREEARSKIDGLRASWLEEKQVCAGQSYGAPDVATIVVIVV